MTDVPTQQALTGFAGDLRDAWWNQDYLDLLARRWQLGQARTLLDVGCSHGHWGHALLSRMAPDAHVTGIDAQAAYLDGARMRAEMLGIADRVSHAEARVEALPFDDDAFDVATGQSVLMHVAELDVALAEMRRVTRPGGLVIGVEPDNLVSALSLMRLDPRPTAQERQQLLAFIALCEEGKRVLGGGDESVGPRLAAAMARVGLQDVTVVQSDRTVLLEPPYADALQQAELAYRYHWYSSDVWLFGDRDTTERYVEAAGGDGFDRRWALAMAWWRRMADAIEGGELRGVAGSVVYVTWGRVP